MKTQEAYTLLETLMDGVNPMTGELLPENHVCQEPAVLQALHQAVAALRSSDDMPVDKTAMVNRNGRLNAGRPWTQKDRDWLKQLHAAGTSVEKMCYLLQRRKRGIEKQLRYLDLVENEEVADIEQPRGAQTGTPWTAIDDKTLWDMWKQGNSEHEIARALQRSSYAIRCRMERLGMFDQDDSDEPPLLPPWSLDDVKRLNELHAQGRSVEEIAQAFNHPVESIRARMFYMGLTKEAPKSLKKD